jgi:hypothetical protein
MTVLSAAPKLHLGDIVWNTNPEEAARRRTHGLPAERGIVIEDKGNPDNRTDTIETTYIIRTGPGTTVYTNNIWGRGSFGQWVRVPEEEWTVEERVTRADMLWQRPDFLPPDYELSNADTPEWQMLIQMLPAKQRRAIMDGDWPSTEEMFYLVARHIDDLKSQAAK